MKRSIGNAALAASLLSLLVAGCGGGEREEEPMPVEETVFGDQVEQIDRAKQQAREMEGRMQDLNSQLDQAEGATREPDGEQTGGN